MVMLKSIADIVQPCPMPVFTSKLVSLLSTLHVVVEAFDDVDNLLWYTIGPKGAPQTFPVHAVKSLLKVYKVDVELPLPLSALLYDVPPCVWSSASASIWNLFFSWSVKAIFTLRSHSFSTSECRRPLRLDHVFLMAARYVLNIDYIRL